MILIVSQNGDPSTDKVIDWIDYLGKKFYRANGEDVINYNSSITFQLSTEKSNFEINSKTISSDTISSVWFRRDSYSIFKNAISENLSLIQDKNYFGDLQRNFYEEYLSAKTGFYSCLEDNLCVLGNFRKFSLNKIDVLFHAKKQGLDIPRTLITDNKVALKDFITITGSVITKSMSEGFGITFNNENFLCYTEEIDNDIIKNIPEKFFTSFFQEKLNKDIEIRIFYLDGKCYSMAIFSQLDNQTKVDFRKYNKSVNNRNVPFQLPKKIEYNIKKLMKSLKLNTGSIDIVKTIEGRYVFLEVNPVGQYDMTSLPCNYYLDKKIAQFLIKDDGTK
jgi:ATP-GRASP peptide maturase of grasp-with-spasm system